MQKPQTIEDLTPSQLRPPTQESSRRISGSTTQGNGWANALNGELLILAEENGFDVVLTADSNIKNQQNIANRDIAILVLRALNNRLATHIEMLEDIRRALADIRASEII